MALFSIVFLIVALVLSGAGMVVGLLACALAVILLGVGVISSSVVIGMCSGRASAGLRAFLIFCGLIAGMPAGAGCAWLTQSLFATHGGGWPILFYGAAGGAFAGLLIALMVDFILCRLHAWASAHLRTAELQCEKLSQPRPINEPHSTRL